MDTSKLCSGCGACQSVCPVSAIQKHDDPLGWFVYTIDKDICINCSLCEKVCPSNSIPEQLIHFNDSEKFAAYSTNPESVRKSASGGVAYEMGKYAIENGYRVVGTEYDCAQNNVRWSIASTIEELEKFRGSKYLQADTEPVFDEVLNTPGKFLVIGTPCQIYGMRKAARHKNREDDLVLVDFVCHGVPSRVIWDAYLREKAEGAIQTVSFRDKTYGWHNRAIKIKSDKGISLEKRSKCSFYHAYDDELFFGEQCYHCELNNGNGVSDIRIGDCWGKEYENNKTGVSRVLIGTEKGAQFFDEIKPALHCTPLKMQLRANNKRRFSAFKARRNAAIQEAMTAKSLASVVKAYRKKYPLKRRIFFLFRYNKLFLRLYTRNAK